MNKLLSIIALLLFCSSLSGQVADPGFARYLADKRSFRDLAELDRMNKNKLARAQKDSLDFYSGWAYYNLRDLDIAVARFSAVSDSSIFFNQANFFASWCEIYQDRLSSSLEHINILNSIEPSEIELAGIFRTGIAILDGDLARSDSLLAGRHQSGFSYMPSWDNMERHHKRMESFNPKSFAAAGILSGIIPGAGKIYAGQKGAGISSLLTLGVMAAVTIENGLKTEWGRWNTIGAASLFGVFYIGNIYGSIAGIKVYRERFHDEIKRAILLDINIPLRDIYR